MKIVVMGGNGRIGSKLVSKLRQMDHEVVAASRRTGVNTVTGEGLAEVLKDAQVVVDVTQAPSFDPKAVMEFFETSGRNLLAAEATAGVKHHVVLSVVGLERVPEIGYFRGKLPQEKLVKQSGIPYSILRGTQFFEFAGAIAHSSMVGQEVHIPPAAFQPVAADEVVAVLSDITVGAPLNSTVEIAGPEAMPMSKFMRYFLEKTNDPHQLIEDQEAKYFGAELNDHSLIPGKNPRLGKIKYEDWISQHASA